MSTPRTVKRDADELTPPELNIKRQTTDRENQPPVSNMASNDIGPGNSETVSDAPSWFTTGINTLKTDLTTDITSKITQLSKEIKDTVEFNSKSAKEALEHCDLLENRVTQLEKENNQLRFKMGLLEDKYKTVVDRLSSLETFSRRDNLIIDGIPEIPNENSSKSEEKVKKVIKDEFNIDPEIARAHRIGEPKQVKPGDLSPKPRPVIVKFQRYKDRQSIWSRKNKLKDTNYFLYENYSREVEETRKLYYPIVRKANSLAEYKNQVFIRMDKLVVKGVEYSKEDLDHLPPELHPNTVHTRLKNGILAFYGKGAYLSNFYPCKFQENGIEFNCVEQYYCYHKARLAGKNQLARRVLISHIPAEMKRITSRIQGLDIETWNEQGPEILAQGLRLKYTSNNRLHNYLVKTKDCVLVESNPHDSYYGAGRSMKEDELFDNPTAQGQNIMGKLLMELRSEFSK